MKILLLNQTFHPDVAATAQYLSDLAAELARQGHRVTVVTSRRAYDAPGTRFPARETWQGVEIYRVDSTAFGKKAKWRRAADFATFLLNCAIRLLRLPRQDVVVALTSPPLISVFGAGIARLWRARFFYWVMDFNPDEAIAAGWLRADSLAARVLERLSRFSLRSARQIIALDRFMRDRIVAKGIAPKRIEIIPPWSHDHQVRFDPEGRTRFRRQHGLEDKFVVMYAGNHSPCHPLDTLLQAALTLNRNPNPSSPRPAHNLSPLGGEGQGKGAACVGPPSTVHRPPSPDLCSEMPSPLAPRPSTLSFLFIGGGSEFARVQRFAAEHKLSNILCLPYQPLDQLSATLSAADLHVVVMGDAFVGLVHPCKIYNILSIGAPVLYLGPAESHLTDLLGTASHEPPSDSPKPGTKNQDLPNSVQHSAANAMPPASGFFSFRHGDVPGVTHCLATISASPLNFQVSSFILPSSPPRSYSRQTCLPRLIALLTR